MAFMDLITEMVAGKARVAKHEQRAFEKKHERLGTEETLRAQVNAAPEPRPLQLSNQCSVSSRSTSPTRLRPTPLPSASRTPSFRPLLFRSQSEISSTTTCSKPIRSTTGPPDITAIDLSDEDIKRNYSTDNIWDPNIQKIPPLLPCTGMGKYRMSIAADPDWQVEIVKQKINSVTPQFVNQMAEVKLGGAHDVVWQRLATEQSSRSSSFASLGSSHSRSSSGLLAESTNWSNGTRITRGFVPSLPSSASSSIKDSQVQPRRDSATSMSSPGSDKSSKTKPPRSCRHVQPLNLSPLSTIKEMHKMTDASHRKIERPCNFDDNGDPDNALASDDDEEEEDGWSDAIEIQNQSRRSSELSRLIEDQKIMPPMPKTAAGKPRLVRTKPRLDDISKDKHARRISLDRSRTIRAARPQFRRQHSRALPDGPTKQAIRKPLDQHSDMHSNEVDQVDAKSEHGNPVNLEHSKSSDEANEVLWMAYNNATNKPQFESNPGVNGRTKAEQAQTQQAVCSKETNAESGRRRVRSGTAFRASREMPPPPLPTEDDCLLISDCQ